MDADLKERVKTQYGEAPLFTAFILDYVSGVLPPDISDVLPVWAEDEPFYVPVALLNTALERYSDSKGVSMGAVTRVPANNMALFYYVFGVVGLSDITVQRRISGIARKHRKFPSRKTILKVLDSLPPAFSWYCDLCTTSRYNPSTTPNTTVPLFTSFMLDYAHNTLRNDIRLVLPAWPDDEVVYIPVNVFQAGFNLYAASKNKQPPSVRSINLTDAKALRHLFCVHSLADITVPRRIEGKPTKCRKLISRRTFIDRYNAQPVGFDWKTDIGDDSPTETPAQRTQRKKRYAYRIDYKRHPLNAYPPFTRFMINYILDHGRTNFSRDIKLRLDEWLLHDELVVPEPVFIRTLMDYARETNEIFSPDDVALMDKRFLKEVLKESSLSKFLHARGSKMSYVNGDMVPSYVFPTRQLLRSRIRTEKLIKDDCLHDPDLDGGLRNTIPCPPVTSMVMTHVRINAMKRDKTARALFWWIDTAPSWGLDEETTLTRDEYYSLFGYACDLALQFSHDEAFASYDDNAPHHMDKVMLEDVLGVEKLADLRSSSGGITFPDRKTVLINMVRQGFLDDKGFLVRWDY